MIAALIVFSGLLQRRLLQNPTPVTHFRAVVDQICHPAYPIVVTFLYSCRECWAYGERHHSHACWGATMLIGGRRLAPRLVSVGNTGREAGSALLFRVFKQVPGGSRLALLVRSLVVLALAISGVVAPVAATAAVPDRSPQVVPAAVPQDPGKVVIAPRSVLPLETGLSPVNALPAKTFASLISTMRVSRPGRSSISEAPRARAVGVQSMAVAGMSVMTTGADEYSVELSYTADTKVHLTATINKSLTTGKYLGIYDQSAGSLVGVCSTGTTCTVTTVPRLTQSTYVATVASYSGTYPPSNIVGTSTTVTPPAWALALTSEIVASKVKLTVTSNYDVSGMGKYLAIYDQSAGSLVAACYPQGTTCTATTVPLRSQSTYIATFATYSGTYPPSGIVATSNTVTPPAWAVMLNRAGTGFTATANYDVSGRGYIAIYSKATGSVASACGTGTQCSASPANTSHLYVATVGNYSSSFPPNPLLAVSNQAGLQGPTGPYETAGGSNPAELNDCYSCVGDPINTSNGEFFETSTDLAVPGRGPLLAASRTYSSERTPFDGPFGFGWSSPYSIRLLTQPDGTVLIEQENGSRVKFSPTGTGTYTAPSHVLATLQANGDGTWTYTRKSREIFTLAQTGSLTSTLDLNGNAISLDYDAQGRLSTATDAAGRALTFAYSTNGRISTITDPANRTSAYTYDPAGRLETVTLPGNRVTAYTYDAGNLLTSMTDPRGSTTVNTYDLARRVTKQTTAAGDLILAYGTDGADTQTTITSPGGRVTKETYRAGQLIKRIVGAGTAHQATWTYAYDQTTFARGTVTDPLNRTTSATYDAQGNKLTATDAGGGQASATYGTYDNMQTSTDAAGTATTYTYNSAGNRLTSSRPVTGTSQVAVLTNTYGDTAHPGDITAFTDPNGNSTTLAYDAYGNRTSVTDALGRTTTTAYDILGRTTSTTTASGKTTTFAYNPAGFLETVTDSLGKVATFTYDAAGNKTSVTDPLGHTTTYTYDALGRHTTTTAADNTTTSSGYDNDGNVTSQTDQNAHSTSYAYDSRNRLTSSTDALNRTTTYAYDAAGQLTGKSDPTSRTTTLSYNAAGDKTGTSYSDGVTPNETFTYTALHQPATVTDGTGTTTMGYDSLGRLTSRTNGAGKNITNGYDLAGNLTTQTYPNGHSVTRTYDAANNLTALTDWLSNTTTFTTTADSRPASTAYANGVTAATTYDNAGLSTNITVSTATATLAAFAYTRNDDGNLATATTSGISQPAESYGYTTRDQLATINTSGYSYDPTGNPTAMATGATLAYDAANQPTQHTLGGTTTPITNDNQGNRLTGPAPSTGTSTYTWNQANRLKTANGTSFTYSAEGLRASRTPAPGLSQTYTWDTTKKVPLMLTDGALSYIYDNAGNPVEHIDANGTVHYYQRDQYGSTRLLTDNTGSVAATYTFDPYGNLTAKTGTADTVLRWNGQAQDADTGLYYLRNRYYDPTTAQFLSVDPLASTTRAIYTYADNNPLNKADPLGLFASRLDAFDSVDVDGAAGDCDDTSASSVWGNNYGALPQDPENCYSWNHDTPACGWNGPAQEVSPWQRCVQREIGTYAAVSLTMSAVGSIVLNAAVGPGQVAYGVVITAATVGGAAGGLMKGLLTC
jgi:RHS repeat-associated protein